MNIAEKTFYLYMIANFYDESTDNLLAKFEQYTI